MMVRSLFAALASTAVVAMGCASPTTPPRAAMARASVPAVSFETFEGAELLRLSALDGRLARRFDLQPGPAVREEVAVEASTLASDASEVGPGFVDVFAFEARRAHLAKVGGKLGRQGGRGLERELFERMIAAELARVDEEAKGPFRTIDLVGALERRVASSVAAPTTAEPVKAGLDERPEEKKDDRLLARRIDFLRDQLAAGDLSRHGANALDDALDPLERALSGAGYLAALSSVADLRVFVAARATETIRTGRPRADRAHEVFRLAGIHVGWQGDELDARRRLAEARTLFADELAPRRLDRIAWKRAEASRVDRLVETLFEPKAAPVRTTLDANAGPLRRANPPPERAAAWALVAAVGASSDAEATVLLHDAATFALWIMDMEGGAVATRWDAPSQRPLAWVPPERTERLLQAIAGGGSQAVSLYGAGLAAVLLSTQPAAKRQAAAQRWLAFGEGPFDIIEREIFGRRTH
jgi:hypothetical protein